MIRCKFCNERLQWLKIRGGRRLPFDAELVERDELPEGTVGWLAGRVTVRGEEYVAVMPTDQCSPGKVAAANRFLVQHACPQYLEQTGAPATPSRG